VQGPRQRSGNRGVAQVPFSFFSANPTKGRDPAWPPPRVKAVPGNLEGSPLVGRPCKVPADQRARGPARHQRARSSIRAGMATIDTVTPRSHRPRAGQDRHGRESAARSSRVHAHSRTSPSSSATKRGKEIARHGKNAGPTARYVFEQIAPGPISAWCALKPESQTSSDHGRDRGSRIGRAAGFDLSFVRCSGHSEMVCFAPAGNTTPPPPPPGGGAWSITS